MLLKSKIGKQSSDRVMWNEAKKKAAAKGIKPDPAFKNKFGEELDKLRDLVEGAKQFIKAFPKGLDPDGKKLINEQAKKCKIIIAGYQKICEAEAKKDGNAAHVAAWKDLHGALHIRESGINNTIRPVVR
jgi:hypothetical protein